jgi:hypothetical protein
MRTSNSRWAAALFCLFPALVSGQVSSASFTGTVKDPNDALIPAAGVRLRNAATGETRQTRTGAEGRYTFSQLLPGGYDLTVEAAGFKTSLRRNIALSANQAGELNVSMQVGEITQSVSVSAAAVSIDTQTANQATTFGLQQLQNLPMSVRSPMAAVHVNAGVVSYTGPEIGFSDQNSVRFAFNGGRDMTVAVLIDGVPANAIDWGGLIISPTTESVQEVQVVRNAYDAQYGKAAGGVVSIVTKGGSAKFHGNVFDLFRNSVLDANSWANNRNGAAKTSFQRNQFGAGLSGPVSKAKRLFFQGQYEGLRQGTPASLTTTLPTAEQRAGNFSQTFNSNGSLSVVYNPLTTRPNPNGAGYTRDPFPNNTIPSSLFDPVGAKIVSLLPQPNQPGDSVTKARNFYGASKTIRIADRYDTRVDWARNEKHTVYVRFSGALQKGPAPEYLGNGLDNTNGQKQPRSHVVLGNTFTPTPTWVVNVLAGSGRWTEQQISASQGMDATKMGFSAALASKLAAPTMPQIGIANYATLSTARWLNFIREVDNLQVNASHERGNHSLKFGVGAEVNRLNDTDVNSAFFNFNRGMTSGPVGASDSSTSGNAIASLLLGTGSSGYAPTSVRPAATQMYYSWYLQDTWRVTPRLTVNAGIRYEIQPGRTERYNQLMNFDWNAASPLAQRVGLPLKGGVVFMDEKNRRLWDTDFRDFAPRVSIAYKVTGKLVLRTGYGIFYLPATGSSPIIGTTGFSVQTDWVPSVGGDGINPKDRLSNPFPNGLNAAPGRSQGLLTYAGAAPEGWQRRHPTAYMQNYSFDLQYEIARGAVLELGYSGNQGRKLPLGYSRQTNQLPTELLSLGSALDQQVANPFYGVIATGTLAGPTVPRQRLLRPYPQFTGVALVGSDTPGASSSFNALTTKLVKQFSNGLSTITSFQWSKAIDNASETQAWEISDNIRDSYDMRRERSISGHDIPLSFVAAAVYELPIGKGKRFGSGMLPAWNVLAGGWQISAITRFAAGLPVQVFAPSTLGNYGFGAARANVADLGELEVGQRSPDMWFNAAALKTPAAYTIGSAPRWIPNVRAGGYKHGDLVLSKSFRYRESLRTTFRAEFYNLTNTPQFAAPNTTVGSGSTGKVSATAMTGPRAVQLGLKLEF